MATMRHVVRSATLLICPRPPQWCPGHTGFVVLLFLHLRTAEALLLAVVQTVLMVATRDHYTLDVLHAWTFCFAVLGRFDPWVS